MIESHQAITFASSFHTYGYIPSRPVDLWKLSTPKWFLTQASSIMGKSSFFWTSSLVSRIQSTRGLVSGVKTEAKKKAFSNSSFSESFKTTASDPHSSRPISSLVFLLLLIYLKKPSLLSFTPSTRWDLAFPSQPLHTPITFLYSSRVACPLFCSLYTSFFFWVFSLSPCSPRQVSYLLC